MKKDDKKMIHRAIDGEATKSETRRFKKCLETDEQAKAEFEQLKIVVKESEKVQVGVPPGFTQKVLKGIPDLRKKSH